LRPGRLSLFAALTIVLLSLQLVAPASAIEQSAPHRIIEVNESGLVYVYDILPAAGDTTRIGFPKEFLKNLVNYACQEDHKPELVVEDDFFWIVVDSASSTEIHLLTIFRDILSWSSATQTFSLKIPVHPRVEGLGRADFSMEVRLPTDAKIEEISPGWLNQTRPGVLSGSLHDLDLSRREVSVLSVGFSSDSLRILDVISAKLLMEVPEGRASMSLRLRLIGGSQLSEVKLRLPKGFELIEAEDVMGKLSSSAGEAGEVVVRLRQPLGEGGSDSFTVVAKVGEGSDLIRLGSDEISIALPMPLNTTIWVYDVEIRLRGGELRSWSPEPIELRREYPEKIIPSYRFDHVDPINAGGFRIILGYEQRMSFFQIAPYLVLVALILVASSITIMYRPRGRVVEKRPSESLIDEASSIIGIYQRLMNLVSGDKIYDRGTARRILLDLRAEVREEVEKIRRIGEKLVEEEPKAAELAKDLVKAAEDFQRAVEKTWAEVYPYLSRSLPRSRLDEALERCRGELRQAYDKFASRLESLRGRLG
jgi:hypothetical protein